MELLLIGFESFGVRSMATFVSVKDVNVFIDPSAALAPRRYGLPPHVLEVEKLFGVFDRIVELLKDSDVVVITHYHYDHHDPGRFLDPELFRGKILLVKHPMQNINVSQRIRAHRFLKLVSDRVRELRYIDGNEFVFGCTKLWFSKPVPHGENSKLGYVVEVCIDDGDDRVLHSSDIEGAPLDEQIEPLYVCRPRIAIVDGPPTYLEGYKYSSRSVEKSLRNLMRVLREIPELEIVILDHHSARELSWFEKLKPLLNHGSELGKKIMLAAQYMKIEPQLLEARRRELFEKDPRDGIELLKNRRIRLDELGE